MQQDMLSCQHSNFFGCYEIYLKLTRITLICTVRYLDTCTSRLDVLCAYLARSGYNQSVVCTFCTLEPPFTHADKTHDAASFSNLIRLPKQRSRCFCPVRANGKARLQSISRSCGDEWVVLFSTTEWQDQLATYTQH